MSSEQFLIHQEWSRGIQSGLFQQQLSGVKRVAGFLIPIRESSTRTLAAVQYALELHKRIGTRQLFLFIEEDAAIARNPLPGTPGKVGGDQVGQMIEEAIAKEVRENGDYLEVHHRTGDYFEVVCDVAQQRHIDEIIVSVPAEDDPTYSKVTQEISMLIQMTRCRVLTINPKKGS
jgi:hypothetical protein